MINITYLLSCTISKLSLIIGQIFASERRVPHFQFHNIFNVGDKLDRAKYQALWYTTGNSESANVIISRHLIVSSLFFPTIIINIIFFNFLKIFLVVQVQWLKTKKEIKSKCGMARGPDHRAE